MSTSLSPNLYEVLWKLVRMVCPLHLKRCSRLSLYKTFDRLFASGSTHSLTSDKSRLYLSVNAHAIYTAQSLLVTMTRDLTQRCDHEKIQQFYRWIKRSYKAGVIASPSGFTEVQNGFICKTDLRDYFTRNDHCELKNILDVLFPDAYDSDKPLRERTIQIATRYLRIFAILLLLKEGRLIIRFTEHDQFTDKQAPFVDEPTHFPQSASPDFFERFQKLQWTFFPAYMRTDELKKYPIQRILPLQRQRPLGKGSSAQTHLFKVHEPYNRLNRRISRSPAPKFIVIKSFRNADSKCEQQFKNEVYAFRHLRQYVPSQDGLVKSFGSFEQAESFHIVLEWADEGNLEDFFERKSPPITLEERFDFLRSLMKILCPLSQIHGCRNSETDLPQSTVEQIRWWHQDIKPENILVCTRQDSSRYGYDFKLADLGLSHFLFPQGNEAAIARHRLGTRIYAPPEVFRERDDWAEKLPKYVKPNSDVWAFGAVLSEAIVWMMNGSQGLKDYRDERRRETKKIYRHDDDGAFHDGLEVLSCVEMIHEKLKATAAAEGDTATYALISLLPHLLAPVEERLESRVVRTLWRRISNDEEKRSILGLDTTHSSGSTSRAQTTTSGSSHVASEMDVATEAPFSQSSLESPSDIIHAGLNQNQATADSILQIKPSNRSSWSFQKAQIWWANVRSNRLKQQQIPGFEMLEILEHRDHIFLVDNSYSMLKHWSQVCEIAEILSAIAIAYDRDGIDLYFTLGRETRRKCKDYADVRKTVKHQCANEANILYADMGKKIQAILQEKVDQMIRKRNQIPVLGSKLCARPLSLYVITDGMWQGYSDVRGPITEALAEVKRTQEKNGGKVSDQFIGIQFIQVGDEEYGRRRLQELDDGLDIGDNIDTEHAEGNVWKIFLGSVNRTFDYTDTTQPIRPE